MIIGIVGFINSGKNTVADVLIENYGFGQDQFAKPLKDAVSIIFGWDRNMLEGNTNEGREWREKVDKYWSEIVGFDLSPRLALQLFGTECIREVFHDDVWSSSLIVRYHMNNQADIVVTDCRFKNEINAILSVNGEVWRVKRGPEPEWYDEYINLFKSGSIETINQLRESGHFPHRSETDWIGTDFDHVIENDGTLYDLEVKVDNIVTGDSKDFFGG